MSQWSRCLHQYNTTDRQLLRVVDDNKLRLQQVVVACIWRVSVNDQSYIKWLTTQSSMDTFHVLLLTSRRLLVTSWPRHRPHYDTTSRQLLRVVDSP